ncbi:MAG: DinB family protein [Candidatus Rokubacteria bacterium]|nr:DinB family protein [Candidatus Rokubacteria bacterium]
MPTVDDYAKAPIAQRRERMARTPDAIAAAIAGQPAAVLLRRPDEKNWAATEIVCHLRDTEEIFFVRFHAIVANDEPKVYADPAAADRWADERQYLTNDATKALAAFRRRRDETLVSLQPLTPEQVQRGCLHPTGGRITIDRFVAMMAWHDDNHLDQLRRALAGQA